MAASRELQWNERIGAGMGRPSLDRKLMSMTRDFLKSLVSRAIRNALSKQSKADRSRPQTRRILTTFFSFDARKHLQHAFGLPSLL